MLSRLLSTACCNMHLFHIHVSICIGIVDETYILLRSTRVVLTHEEDDDRVLLCELFSPMSKRLFLFFMIPFIESCILASLYYVGSKFIITSDDVSDLIINSVAIAFIMDVDNLAREFFQSEEVSDHVDKMEFESKMQQMEPNWLQWMIYIPRIKLKMTLKIELSIQRLLPHFGTLKRSWWLLPSLAFTPFPLDGCSVMAPRPSIQIMKPLWFKILSNNFWKWKVFSYTTVLEARDYCMHRLLSERSWRNSKSLVHTKSW